MKKKICLSLCIASVLIVCIMITLFLLNIYHVPYEIRSQDVDIAVSGDVYLESDVEPELIEIIKELENNIENVELTSSEYFLDDDGAGNAFFSFRFDEPGNAYSRFWERMNAQDLEGTLEMWISMPEARIYHVRTSYMP